MSSHGFSNTQPAYDFLTSGSSQSPTRQAVPRPPGHSSQITKTEIDNEELRIQVNTLRYELENFKQERDLMSLRHEKERRDLQLKADTDFRKAQSAEAASNRANHKSESLTRELKDVQDRSLKEKVALEKQIKALEDQNQSLQEDAKDLQAQLSDQERQYKYQINELEMIRSSLQKTLEELRTDLEYAWKNLSSTQERLSQREAEVAQLETDNLRLTAEGNDAETSAVLKRELSEQVTHIRNLESKNREQLAELRHLRKIQKNVEVVEEQKTSLENKLHLMKELEAELGNVRIQKEVLEDERRSWTSHLQVDGQPAEFDSPETVVKALVQERIEKVMLVDKLGNVEPQISEKDEIIKCLETEKYNLRQEIEKVRNAGPIASAMAESRARIRLERQRALAVKEVEYLRAQLKTFDTEEITMNADENRFDEQKSEQIAQLETLVDEYRAELQKVHGELSTRETLQDELQPRGTKRPPPADNDAENERIAVLLRKNRTVQESLSKSEQTTALLRHELEATKSQLNSLQEQSRIRILELRSNPTSEAENIKMSALKALKAENRDLLAQLRDEHINIKVVPVSTLDSMKLEIQEMEKLVAEKEKHMRRLKETWALKSSEFREAVASVLGYKLDFLPSGRVRVTSMFHLSSTYRHGDGNASADSRGPGSMGDGEENSIVFDGEKGTMKISGGPNSLFALEIRHLIKFWVEERKDIPCFLAAMTLEFYDKTTRAARI
ncbi:hypothetical protein Egran_00773 [Elaphomyces granulatus]|uniref:Spindle assembly checkpoint component MAD1 n=1 Tax=Elaphomyces granulatus TaxID=519963 RepID=A0A232M503_9EURO|nr:hypothetical protein Egran_00773 [Elaphomyces granulatus]